MKRLYLKQQREPMDSVHARGVTRDELQRWHDTNTWPVQYRVTKVVGSTTPKIDDLLNVSQVNEYCLNTENWQVDIT